ncbi:aminotransferase class I/II-fold pyridoxal phosphate-dependent enzyme [Streptomyces sp. TG1A-60]|uniref:aminotransferase class I/II-fold pyridoxal phosphate-dependent enzyme n=1 Tax=Streptomyces sp. TG1A-60 TaxID=3129111 RepID=UPI0030D46912
MNQGSTETHWQGNEPQSVAGLLRHHLEHHPDALAYRFLTAADTDTGTGTGTGTHDPGADAASWNYRELDLRVRGVAARLQREGLAGKPVLLLHPSGLDYVAGFLGCLYAGAIAVPAYPPDTRRFGQTMPRLAAIARDSQATHALTTGSFSRFAATRKDELAALGLGGLRWLVTDDLGTAAADDWRDPGAAGDSPAFLQYTSGSTSAPKGVMVSNGNLIHNLRSIHHRLEHDANSAMVSWLPPYHDMGLVGGILTPLYGGFPAHLMSPLSFVRRPLLWLQTLSRTRASTSVAPNFGFEHCVRRVTDEQLEGLDLSHWRLALNGAEPVRADTLDRFAERFAPWGFERRALLPCYGLAEATLMVTGLRADEPPTVGAFASSALGAGVAEPAREPEDGRVTRVVGCGPAVDGVDVAIVDASTRRRISSGDRIGEIWVTGASVALGYWRRPEATHETFRARIEGEDDTPYLRTGDLGFLRDGQLHVVGRTKDVVIVQGRNHYPHDIELTVEKADDSLRTGSGAAFAVEVDGVEEMVVAYEVEGRRVDSAPALLAKLRMAIAEEHEVTPHAVVLLKRSTAHKTTSGKIQRQACRRDFLGLGLTVVAASVTRDTETPLPPDSPADLPAGRRGQRVLDAVNEVLTGVSAAADPPDVSGWTFAELDLDYPALLTAVRDLEQRLGTTIAVGELLVRPRVDTLIALLLGEERGPDAEEPGSSPPETTRPETSREPEAIEAWLVGRVAGRLGLPPASIDVTKPLASLGLDSKQAVAILAELGSEMGREVTTSAAFDHPTIRAVATHFGSPDKRFAAGAITTASYDGRVDEPIAVIGLGCRFPGAPDVDSYWRLLVDGRDAITEVPGGRWDADRVSAPGYGGFIDHADEFDPRFFGLSAREAIRMDPQQRLLLEIAWQTVEDAGIAPSRLAGSDTGVFVGISSHDYSELQMSRLDTIDIHAATGNAHSIAANRLSYTLDLQGPSLALDTACSSSLLAVHLACESLRRGECVAALAGGVNLLITPGLSVAFSEGNMLSPDGRCRTFDDSASGYARGEGAGLVLLKPLSAAIADGDRIHAVIRGSATGHGGRSNGLTAPKGSAQRAVIERALSQAGLSGDEIGYVEAHGTGTSLGDPVEWEGLAAVYGSSRTEGSPCLVGSVKTNIGHLEAAAGIAGLIKAALVVRNRQVPPTLHLRTPNRHLAWDGAGLGVPTRLTGLPDGVAVRAGVSSFGFGGSNAHVVLESPPEPTRDEAVPPKRPVHALCLSAHTPTALTALAQRWRTHLAAHPDADLGDLCRTASTGRAQLAFRAVVAGGSTEAFDTALDALARGEASTAVVRGRARPAAAPKVAFLFSGQGTQYTGMGKGLYDTHTGFARTLDRADRVLRPRLGVPLTELLFAEDGADRLRSTRYCQPALVALEVALAELWMSLGVRPTALLGHSIGAYGAACVAGVMSLEDALTLAVVRARQMDEQPGDGAMIACAGDAEAIRAAAVGFGSVSVAAVNAPGHLVLSGARKEIDEVRVLLQDRSVVVRPLAVSHAFHSTLMAGAAEPLREAARAVAFAEPEIPWVFDATGELVATRIGADDWVEHLLGTVRFADGFETLRGLGCDAFVEIGPHPTLLNMARTMTAADDENPVLWLPSLRRGRGGNTGGGDWETLLQSLGRLHCAGGEVDWTALDEGYRRHPIPIPHAVLERQPYWFRPPPQKDERHDSLDPAPVRRPEPPSAASADTASNGRTEPASVQPAVPAAAVPADEGTARHVVVGLVARVCSFPVEGIPLDARLGADLGFDSLMRTELERSLTRRFPGRLEDHRETLPEDPTVGQLADLLGTEGTAVLPDGDHPADGSRECEEPVGSMPAPAGPGHVVKQERVFEEWAEYAELQGRLRQTRSSGVNPYGRVHEGHNSGRASVEGRLVINFSSFNYLALSNHPRVRRAAQDAIDRYGTSSSATPLLFGETPLHHELDAEIASFLGTDAAIVYAGGHATNVATIGHLFGPEDLILHDEWIHDSAVRGCILSGARRRPFPHNDWRALDSLLGTLRSQHRRALVLVEGAYSQDGDIPDLRRFIDVKERHGAMLMIDEAHSIGVLGRTGRGIGEYFGVDRRDVDLWMGTLSKAIGSLGGYIASRGPIIEYLKYTTPLHIFSTGISPANTAAALEAIRIIREEPDRVARVRQLSEHFRDSARARGLDIGVSRASAVIPVVIGDWEKTMALSNALLDQGVNVMPIGYPAVARDECRLRFFINADHSEEDLEHSLDLLGRAMAEKNTRGTPPTASTSEHEAARTGITSGSTQAPASTPEPKRLSVADADADVLVAGASGFIGGHLTRRLAERGHRVRVLVRQGSDRSAFDGVDVEIVTGDLDDPESLRRATTGVRHVYNCTGMSADWGPWEDFARINVDGGRNLVEAAHHAGTVERFLHVSTTDVYGYPVTPCDESADLNDIGLPYNRSKVLGERAVREAAERAGLPLTVVRPVSVYGPRSKDFVIEIATLLVNRQMVYIRRGEVPAGLIYVGNLVDGMIAACTSEAAVGKAYNLRDHDLTTWREYIEALARGLGVKSPAFSLPTPVARGVASVSEKLYGALGVKSRPVLTRHAVHLFDRDQSYAVDRARDDFGFKSEVGFEEGVELTLAWLDSPEGRKHVAR